MPRNKNKKIVDAPFIKGQYIKKVSNGLFNTSYQKGKKTFAPVIKIGTAYFEKRNDYWHINAKYQIRKLDDIEIIDSQEAERLFSIYRNLPIEEGITQSIEKTCMTMYTGRLTEKVKYENISRLKLPLYQLIIKRPNEGFVGYQCPNCGFCHIGRKDDLK